MKGLTLHNLPIFSARTTSWVGRFTKISILVTMVLGISNHSHYEIVSDAWAGATSAATQTPTPANPVIKLSDSSPTMTNNVIYVEEGQPASICVAVTDPNGYNSLNLNYTSSITLDTSNINFAYAACSGSALQIPKFTWNTQLGDAAKYPSTTITFTASNTYFSPTPTTKRSIHIVIQNSSQPLFDSLTNQTLTVGVPLTLPIVATGNTNALDTVLISAQSLPKGAKLSKATLMKIGTYAGKWMSTFKWTPTEAQYKALDPSIYTGSFIAKYKNAAAGLSPTQSDVKFTVMPPVIDAAAIKQLIVSKAAWSVTKNTLTATGTVKFTQKFGMVTNIGVMLTNAKTGELITTAPIPVADNGQWKLSNQQLATAPCSITANVVHIDNSQQDAAVITKAVSKAPAGSCA